MFEPRTLSCIRAQCSIFEEAPPLVVPSTHIIRRPTSFGTTIGSCD
jgi:hypothetical protein